MESYWFAPLRVGDGICYGFSVKRSEPRAFIAWVRKGIVQNSSLHRCAPVAQLGGQFR